MPLNLQSAQREWFPLRIWLPASLLLAACASCRDPSTPGSPDATGDARAAVWSSGPTPASATPTSPGSSAFAAPSASSGLDVPDCGIRAPLTKLLWMGKDYEIVIDREALACLSNAERAAVGYVAAVVGSQCSWVKHPDAEGRGGQMHCKLTTALGLGHQCQERHKGLLARWLGDQIPSKCWMIPTTAFAQAVVDEVTLARQGSRIKVAFKATGTTGPSGKAWSWSETLVFEENGPETLKLVRHDVKGKPF